MPKGEFAIILDGTLLLCLFAFSEILIRTSGHIYVDIGFRDPNGRPENEILIERASGCALELADYLDHLMSDYPPLEFVGRLNQASDASATSGLTPWMMAQGYVELILGHELGHAYQQPNLARSDSAIPVRITSGSSNKERHARELDADLFAYRALKHISGGVLLWDYFFRLSALYCYATSGWNQVLASPSHPGMDTRFGSILKHAVEDSTISKSMMNNIAANHLLWIKAATSTLEIHCSERLKSWRDRAKRASSRPDP